MEQDRNASQYQPTSLTPIFRLSYPHLINGNDYAGKITWGWTSVFDEDAGASKEMKSLRKVVEETVLKKWGSSPQNVANFKSPFRNNSEKNGKDGFNDQGQFIICLSEFAKPPEGIRFLDRSAQAAPIIKVESMFYAGCYCRAIVTCYPWVYTNERGQLVRQGVSFAPHTLQFFKAGDPFRPTADPSVELSAFEGEDDNDGFDDGNSTDGW